MMLLSRTNITKKLKIILRKKLKKNIVHSHARQNMEKRGTEKLNQPREIHAKLNKKPTYTNIVHNTGVGAPLLIDSPKT